MLYAPLVTPFQQNGDVDFQAWEENLAAYAREPLDGFLINGSSAEAEMLSESERLELLKRACESGSTIIAGVCAQSNRVAREQVEALAEFPLESVLVRTPSYFGKQMDQIQFFSELADFSPHPLMIYQIPQYTGVKLDSATLRELSQHPNIVGIKDSLGDLAMLTQGGWPDDFRYLLGAAGLLLPGLTLGARGGILALANVLPKACRRLLELAPEEPTAARELQAQLIPVNTAIGGSRGFGIAGLKAAVEIQGYRAGPPRRPLRPITPDQRVRLQELLSLFNH